MNLASCIIRSMHMLQQKKAAFTAALNKMDSLKLRITSLHRFLEDVLSNSIRFQ